MGFDKTTPGHPVVNLERRTTQVNIWVAIGVAVMILAAMAYLVHAHRHPGETQASASHSLDRKP